MDEGGHALLRLTDKAGAPLSNAVIDAHAERPLGPPESTVLTFRALDGERYQAETPLAFGNGTSCWRSRRAGTATQRRGVSW